MYAVFRTGGKQYRASEGDRLRLERLNAGVGDTVEFDQVLLVGEGAEVQVGSPLVTGGKVSATVTAEGRGRKIDVVKFKRRTNYKRQHGHRQWYTEVRITSISGGGAPSRAAAAAEPEAVEPASDSPASDSTE